MGKHVYVERADPDAKGYEVGTRRYNNVISRYQWANRFVSGITIDMPCGMGWGTSYITTNVLIGIDICPEAIEKAKLLYPEIRFEVGNMLNTSFPSNYADSIVCCEGYEHVERKDQFKLMREIHRVLRNRGTVCLTVPVAKYVGDHTGDKFHLYEPTLEEIERTIKGRFETIEFTKPNVARFVLEAIK